MAYHDAQIKTSEALSKKGISGVQFVGDGGKNHFQVFNPSDIKITKRTKIQNEPTKSTGGPSNTENNQEVGSGTPPTETINPTLESGVLPTDEAAASGGT